jgi:hypothetical protein
MKTFIGAALSVTVLTAIATMGGPRLSTVASAQSGAPSSSVAQTYYHVAFSNPAPGTEDEYNRWYDTEHGPAVVAIPGFVTAQRYVANDVQVNGTKPWAKYVIVYRIETNDLPAVQAEFSRRIKSGEIGISPTFQSALHSGYYKALGPWIPHKGDAPTRSAGTVDSFVQFVFNNPIPDKGDEFNQWMDTQHVRDMLSVPGYVEARRLRTTSAQPRTAGDYDYLTMFRIVTSDLPALVSDFRQRAPKWFISPALDKGILGATYKPLGPELNGDAIRARARAR